MKSHDDFGVSFTDDDLKRLKEAMVLPTTVVDSQDLTALIARLEAAEKAASMVPDYMEGFHDEFCWFGKLDEDTEERLHCDCGDAKQALQTWRRAKGDVSDSEQAARKDQ